MENPNEKTQSAQISEQEESYEPRPLWQVWAARVGLVLFLLLVLLQIVNMVRGTL